MHSPGKEEGHNRERFKILGPEEVQCLGNGWLIELHESAFDRVFRVPVRDEGSSPGDEILVILLLASMSHEEDTYFSH